MSDQQNLFHGKNQNNSESHGTEAKQGEQGRRLSGPLAERMRPLRLEQYIGQDALLGQSSALRRAIQENRIHSFILWGPPGSGKTTLARIIAEHTECEFVGLSAVMAGVKDIKEVMETAKREQLTRNKKTILFIDEIHRFNKSQQDALLPFVENGTVTLIGATTENPSFEVNSALLSRVAVYVLKPLSSESLVEIFKRALMDVTYGLGALQMHLSDALLVKIAEEANGDARRGLGLLERFVDHFAVHGLPIEVSEELFRQVLGQKRLRYDAKGEEHYNTISAFIKSMRDSDPDAALYYLARMIEAGEDPLFIARRLVIFASEDIGNADPRALTLAMSVRDAVDVIGMPEARICLAQGVTFLSVAPKSNASYAGINMALADVEAHGNLEIPLHIRNAPTKFMKGLGYGKDYKYSHDYKDNFTGMINLPTELKDRRYYEPKDSGLEKQIKEKLDQLRAKRSGKP